MSESSGYLHRLPTVRRRLDNGLTVVVREDHSAPVVAVVTWVKAGYFDETDDIIGISHVLEHMYFKGTPRRGPGEIARETKSAGGYLNAGTIYDHTSYYTVLPSASLEQALDIQSDALLNSAIDAGELATELQVIIQEARRKLDNPGAVAEETLFELLHDTHRIRRWRIGLADALAQMTREQIVKYYRDMYTPSNAIVVIAGDAGIEQAFDLVRKYYGDMKPGPDVRDVGPTESERTGFRFRELSGDVMQTTIECGWRTVGPLHEDTAALDVLAIVLGQGRASRLYRGVREKGLVTAIHANNYTPTQLGVFTVSAEAEPAHTIDALKAIMQCIHDVRDRGVTTDEMNRARSILEARHIRRLETCEGQANTIAEWEALGNWELAEEYLAHAMSVTSADLVRVATKYLADDRAAVLTYKPEAAASLDVSESRLAEQIFAPTSHTESAVVSAPVEINTLKAMRVRANVDGDVRVYENDGKRVVIMQRHSAPLISMSLSFRGGSLHESASEAGITSLMARASVKGTKRRTAVMLAEASEALGASIGFGVGSDSFEWGMTLPSRHFDTGLDLMLDAALEPSFPTAEVAREREIMLRDLEQLRDDMYQYPMRLAMEAAFGAHPYGFSAQTVERAVAHIDAKMLHAWHNARVLHGEPWFFISGDVEDADRTAGLVFSALKAIHADAKPLAERRPVWPAAQQVRVEERAKQQTAMALAFPGPDRNDRDLDAIRLLSSAVSGLGGRLFEELRSKRSLAYSIAAFPMARWRAGAVIAYIGTSPAREEEARAGMLEQLGLLRTELLSADEVERAKEYAIGAWQIRSQTNAGQLAEIAGAMMFGGGLAEVRSFPERVRAITAEQMRAAAERFIQPDRVVEGVVRGNE